MHGAGVIILAGTDCHDEPSPFYEVDHEVDHGESLHGELEPLAESTPSNIHILRVRTILRAEVLKLSGRNVISEGKLADLNSLRDDLIRDISAMGSNGQV